MKTKNKKIINLALQGGGSHGAFTWGVIDRLLEDKDIQIEGLSGTSAGGMNAAALAQGFIKGGNQSAKDELRRYWEMIMSHNFSQYIPNQVNDMLEMCGMKNDIGYQFMGLIQRSFSAVRHNFSPYEWNPVNINPLRGMVDEFYDFDLLKSSKFIKLFLATTHVKSGKPRVFNIEEICADVLLASACLPSLFHAVEIGGEEYWDGGYIANPAIYPLIYECTSPDIVVIQLTPTQINEVPRTAEGIQNRHAQITFGSCLLREMRMIHFMSELIDHGFFQEKKIKRVYMHMIEDNELFSDLNPTSAASVEPAFIEGLFQAGRKSGEKFLSEHKENLGKKTTADLEHYF
jgi:NTE family protein